MKSDVKKILSLPAGAKPLELALGWNDAVAETVRPAAEGTSSSGGTVGDVLGVFVRENFPFDKRRALQDAGAGSPFLYVSGAVLDQQKRSIITLVCTLSTAVGGMAREETMVITPVRSEVLRRTAAKAGGTPAPV